MAGGAGGTGGGTGGIGGGAGGTGSGTGGTSQVGIQVESGELAKLLSRAR